ncbi:MAG: STAS domain-containing protein [Chloroflexota bacterium]
MSAKHLAFRIKIFAIVQVSIAVFGLSIGLVVFNYVPTLQTILLAVTISSALLLYFLRAKKYAVTYFYLNILLLFLISASIDPTEGSVSGASWTILQLWPPLVVLVLRRTKDAVLAVLMGVSTLITLALLEINQIIPIELLLPVENMIYALGLQVFIMIALSTVTVIISQSERRAIEQTSHTQKEVEAQLDHVQRLLTEKEQLNTQLEESLAEVREREQQIVEGEVREKQLDQTIQAIMSPIIPVTDNVVIVPLVGTFDDSRLDSTGAAIIRGVEQHRAKIIVLDTTGISLISEHLAQMIVQTARAAQLLGTTPVLVGLRPELAQSLIAMEIDFESLITYADLREAIRFALAKVDLQVA